MFGTFADVMPRTLVASVVLWAGASHFVIGPVIASRVALFDHIPACELNHQAATLTLCEIGG